LAVLLDEGDQGDGAAPASGRLAGRLAQG